MYDEPALTDVERTRDPLRRAGSIRRRGVEGAAGESSGVAIGARAWFEKRQRKPPVTPFGAVTTYRRSCHWRRGKDGSRHWVSPHSVSRGGSATYRNAYRSSLTASYSTSNRSVPRFGTQSLVIPNASCPVCGASVCFYSNAHGAKVYFDDLGWPWPKHPSRMRPLRGPAGHSWSTTPIQGASGATRLRCVTTGLACWSRVPRTTSNGGSGASP